jgi:glycosyltransferase involved in cell wall biosynthesis/phospholipid N-methyltransferase
MLSVIIPAYNERYTIREIVRRVRDVPVPKEIIIVDDFSTDGTRDILRALEKEAEGWGKEGSGGRLKVVYQPRNQGKGAALRAGIPYASQELTVIQDADLEYNPADYLKLMEPIVNGQADVVYGSRFTGTHRRVLFFWHSIGNKMLTFLSNVFSNLNLTDMESCYKMFRTSILRSIPLRSNRFGFEPEVTAKIAKLGCRIYEVPIEYHGRTYAQGKKIGFKDAVQALYVILKYWLVDDLYSEGSAGLRTLRIMEGAGKYNHWLFRQCEPFLGARVLEMGAGIGNITQFLLDRARVVASDVSDGHLRELRAHFGGFPNVRVERVDMTSEHAVRSMEQEKIDSILSMNVLEHIEDDKTAVRRCFEILQPKGRLVLLVPAHQSLFSPMDKHLGHHRRYDPPALLELLESAGFRVTHRRSLNVLGALGWFVNGRVLRRRLIPSRQVRLFDVLIRLLDIEKKLNPSLGLSVLMVAEKPDR